MGFDTGTTLVDYSNPEIGVSRLGVVFGLLEKASIEVAELIKAGSLVEGFQLEDVEVLISDSLKGVEIVRGANSDLEDAFQAGYGSFQDDFGSAAESAGGLTPKI